VTAPAMTSKEVVEKFFKLFDADDLVPFKSILHPQISWTMMGTSIPGFGTAYIGPDVIVDTVIAPARAQFDGRPVSKLNNMIVAGPWVVAEIEGFGNFKDGRKYQNSYCIVFEVQDGLVKTLREYMDTGYILKLMQH
jgi:ketosteroid isomerase-like protein